MGVGGNIDRNLEQVQRKHPLPKYESHFINPCTGLLQSRRVPRSWGSRFPWKSLHEGGKVISLTHRPPLPPRKYTCVKRLSLPQGHGVAGRIISMKNSHDPTGNRNRDLPACSSVSQPTAPPHQQPLELQNIVPNDSLPGNGSEGTRYGENVWKLKKKIELTSNGNNSCSKRGLAPR